MLKTLKSSLLFHIIVLASCLLWSSCDIISTDSDNSLEFVGGDYYFIFPDFEEPEENFTIQFSVLAENPHEFDSINAIEGTGGLKGQRFLLTPKHGGQDRRGVGISIGSNGVSVYEYKHSYIHSRINVEMDMTIMRDLTLVYNDNAPTLYIDGELVGSGKAAEEKVFAGFSLGEIRDANLPFVGQVNNLKIWNRSLSESEVVKMQMHETEGVVLQLSFDEFYQLKSFQDQSGNQNHASLRIKNPALD